MNPSQILQRTTTGDVTTTDATLKTVILAAGSDAATVVVKAGGASGTTILKLAAATATTEAANLPNVYCDSGIHVTLTGTSPAVSVCWE